MAQEEDIISGEGYLQQLARSNLVESGDAAYCST